MQCPAKQHKTVHFVQVLECLKTHLNYISIYSSSNMLQGTPKLEKTLMFTVLHSFYWLQLQSAYTWVLRGLFENSEPLTHVALNSGPEVTKWIKA